MCLKKKWRYKTSGSEGRCKLFGVNIFDYKWQDTEEEAVVADPLYHQTRCFSVFTVNIKGRVKRFAAGEFSNGMWGFFVERYF